MEQDETILNNTFKLKNMVKYDDIFRNCLETPEDLYYGRALSLVYTVPSADALSFQDITLCEYFPSS